MQRQEKDPLGQMFAFILFPQNGTRKGNLSSALLPDTVSMAATALGSATEIVRYLHGGAGLQQQHDHLDVAIQRCQVQGRSASGRRPRGSPHGVNAWANESWKTRKLRVPKIVSPGRANIAHHLTKECQEKRKGGGSCEGLKHNARCGLVAGMEVIGQVFLPRETYTVHYTVKRKVCAGLKPIWLVQVWRQRDLESIVLDLRVRTCPPISAFTQDWNPPTLFFNITSSGPYPWSILTDQSSFIVLLLCGQRWYSESKRSEPANLLWHFHQKN